MTSQNIINMDIPGLTSFDDLATLATFVKELEKPGSLVVEIGTFCGRSTYVLSKNCIPGTIILSIDGWFIKDFNRFGINIDDSKRVFLETKRKYNLSNVIQIPKTSPLRRWDKKKIDMLFIDGGHIFRTVLKELNFYTQFCSRDAIICGHDYNRLHSGVINAVNFFADENNYIVERFPTCIWRLRKK
jgi:hypothetical protein